MPPASREIINRAILDAIGECGAVGLRMQSPAAHPRMYLVAYRNRQISIWVYCWTITRGGRPSLAQEYRIQMTTVESPLPLNPDGFTILLGYEPDRDVFAGFDLERHRTFTSGSPSVQVSVATLNNCLQDGLAFQTKSNDEIAIGVRSDHLLFYCEHARELHGLGVDSTFVETAERIVTTQKITDLEIQGLPEQRQLVIRETARWSRSSTFTKRVLNAYDNRCAVTRRKLKLVDAAHILPVQAGDKSIDNVRNGIALSPTYHRAFDRGLIFLDESMVMRLNGSKADDLMRLGLDSGIESFAAQLGKIHLPYNPEQHPDPYFIHLANSYRGLRG